MVIRRVHKIILIRVRVMYALNFNYSDIESATAGITVCSD
jgi:hypothetical protein